LQAPNGSNRNRWEWIVLDDSALIAKAAELYRAAMSEYTATYPPFQESDIDPVPGGAAIYQSALHLAETLGRVPALLFPLMPGRPEGEIFARQASMWGSILPAVWSFFLAARSRGLGSAWTSVHVMREREMAELLGVRYDDYTQVGLFPIAYTKGTDFKKAWRKPASDVLSWNRFGQR
jgi:nitroreductase